MYATTRSNEIGTNGTVQRVIYDVEAINEWMNGFNTIELLTLEMESAIGLRILYVAYCYCMWNGLIHVYLHDVLNLLSLN